MSGAFITPVLGVLGLAAAFMVFRIISARPAGEGRISEIGEQIHLGAMVFMRREYTMLAIFAAVLMVAIFFSPLGWKTAFAFLVGALTSAFAGFVGMFTATKANVRTTTAARDEGIGGALSVAFFIASILAISSAHLDSSRTS